MTSRQRRRFTACEFLVLMIVGGAAGWAPVWVVPLVACVLTFRLASGHWVRFLKVHAPMRERLAWTVLFASLLVVSFSNALLGLLLLMGSAQVAPGASLADVARGRSGRLPTFCLLALFTLVMQSTTGCYVLESIAAVVSIPVGTLVGGDVDLGPTYSGALAFLVAALAILTQRRSVRQTTVWILTLSALTCGAGASLVLIARALPNVGTGGAGFEPSVVVSILPWIFVLVGALVLQAARVGDADSEFRVRCLAAFVGGALLLTCLVEPPADRPSSERWLLYEDGFLNWNVPIEGQYGQYSAGMLGTLPDLIRLFGGTAEVSRDLSPESLRGVDAVLIVNLDHQLASDSVTALEEFVRKGGTLCLVGEHTFVMGDSEVGTRLHLNDVLEFTGIRFENDSADQLQPRWRNSIRTLGGVGLTKGVGRHSVGPLVGGALHLSWPAAPWHIGKFGYVDRGLEHKSDRRGYLGNLYWDSSERLGDVVLSAYEKVGAGAVVVFGDTTGLFNAARFWNWKWWGEFFCLSKTGPSQGNTWLHALVACVLLMAAASGLQVLTIIAFLAMCAGIALPSVDPSQSRSRAAAQDARPLALVDSGSFQSGRIGSWELDGSVCLTTGLYRAGYFSAFDDLRETIFLQDCHVAVVARPRRCWSARDSSRLLSWVRAGGRLIIGTGLEHRDSLQLILAEVGCLVEARPLGHIQCSARIGSELVNVEFLNAWPLSFGGDGAWTAVASTLDGSVVVGVRSFGRGSIAVVGDSRFLQNRSLEGTWGQNPGNLRLFGQLVELE